MSAPGYMREAMPGISAFIDEVRQTFGEAEITQAIRDGRAAGTFWAMEGNGEWSYEGNSVIGHPFCDWPPGVKVADMIIDPPNVERPRKAKR